MIRMTGPDCAVMCNLINTHNTHAQTHIIIYSGILEYIPIDSTTLIIPPKTRGKRAVLEVRYQLDFKPAG